MSSPTVLVIDDSDDDFYVFQRACRRSHPNVRLHRCCDGAECREYLARLASHQEPWPVLVFLDLNMPGADGRQLLQEIKGSNALRQLRVVVYSTSDNPADINFCYSNFANAYHSKPLEYEDMRTDLSSILDYWLQRAQEASPVLVGG